MSKDKDEIMTNQETKETVIHPSEAVLEDDYPVHWNYCYVVDGKVRFSPLGGGATVADLKREFSATEIRRCDMRARKLF